MRFLAFHFLDLRDEKIWSNIPGTVLSMLESRGHEVVLLPPLHPEPYLSARLKYVFFKKVFNRIFMQARDARVNKKRAQIATRQAREIGHYDAVITFFMPEIAYFQTTRPIVAVQDATFELVLDYYDTFRRSDLAPTTVRDGIELDRRGLASTSHVVYCSEWAARGAIEGCGYSPAKISIQALGASIASPPTRKQVETFVASRGHGTCRFLFIGKEWQRKGGPIAVAILSELELRGLKVEFNIVGCRPTEPLPAFARVHGPLWKNVEAEAGKLRTLFEECDFYLMPSHAECFGIVFCEAAAFGLPVIATETGGVREAVSQDWGLLLPPGSPAAAYADWIYRAYKDRELYRRMALAAHSDFEHRLNWEVFTDHLIGVTEGLVGISEEAKSKTLNSVQVL